MGIQIFEGWGGTGQRKDQHALKSEVFNCK